MKHRNRFYPLEDVAYWFTANGNHIPVKHGQTREEAMNAFLKEHGDPRGKSVEELRGELAVDSDGLTSDERRIWREACERIARGFKGIAPQGENGCYYVSANKKIIVTAGEYPFQIVKVYSFRTHEKHEEFLRKIWKN